jgi:ketosteroid isomerase-like protein
MHARAVMSVRTLVVAGLLFVLVAPLSACGGESAKAAATESKMQRQATLYEVDQIERTFHKAGSRHDVNLMMSLWAPGAVFNVGTHTYTGKAQIRRFFEKVNPAFQPQNHWVDDTPSYKIRITVNGDKATLYMQCHYIDVTTGKVMAVVGVDHNLQKIHGKWLIVEGSGAPTVLSP